MTESLADLDEAYFEDLIGVLSSHPDWTLDTGTDGRDEYVDAVLADAVRGPSAAELAYDHRTVPAELYVRVPDLGTPPSAAEGFLIQPLIPGLDRLDTEFGDRLADAHRAIAATHATPYLSAEADPRHVLGLSVPISYDAPELTEALDAASTVVNDVAQLHEEIRSLIREYCNG